MATHLSVRLTWHDSGWNGCVCKAPLKNVSCVAHEHIRESRDADKEQASAGNAAGELDNWLPPCSRDLGAYSDKGFTIVHQDPVGNRKLPPAVEILPPYTVCPSPYRWMREENLRDILSAEQFKVRPSEDASKANGWVYEPDRQESLLSRFWGKLEKKKSLVFYYCNQANPLSEDHARVLMGIGRISAISEQLYFGKKKESDADQPIWSRAVTQNYPAEGVRIPYQEYIDNGNSVESILCPIPAAAISAFSYVGEHVSDDIALGIVERAILSIQQVRKDGIIPGNWDDRLQWLDEVLQELWRERGAFPGIGSVLQYLGFSEGMAYQRFVLAPLMHERKNIWEHLESILNGDLEPEKEPYTKGLLTASTRWQKLSSRQHLLRKLSRFELSAAQVERIAVEDQRQAAGIWSSNEELVANPYLICEQDTGTKESSPVALETIDHGMRPAGYAALFPDEDEVLQDDPRRIRAIAVEVLKNAQVDGDSLLGLDEFLTGIRERFAGSRACSPDLALLIADEDFYKIRLECHFGKRPAWVAIKRLYEQEQKIAGIIKRRSRRQNRISWDSDFWRDKLVGHPKIGTPKTERESVAIEEKIVALKKLFEERICLLTGGAGTGKTTVLKVFIDGLEEVEGKKPLLLLAPTGKARVRLSTSTKRNAATIHQFLFKQGWLDPNLFILKETGDQAPFIAHTVVIDECSMIPSDVFAILLEALDKDAITRLILVGDPNQLPPIGPGRPFADIIAWLSKHADHCVARLETCMRTMEGAENSISVGLQFANSYRSNDSNPGDDELLSQLAQGKSEGDISINFWKDTDDLMSQIKICLDKYLGIKSGDYEAFSNSLGFTDKQWEQAEKWQILSPTRRDLSGTDEINRIIQKEYKGGLLSNARNPWKKNHYKFGDAEIVWTDKVIQISNQSRNAWPSDAGLNYVANGEIGLVTETGAKKGGTPYLQIHFSTQADASYRFYKNEVDGLLELAYGLTVHKAQGSDFETVFLIIPQEASTLSRELIYTGLTRFRKRIVLLVQKDIQPLLRLRQGESSEVERRNTFTFDLALRNTNLPEFMAHRLIHCAQDGTRMRSKSEVIVANILLNLGLKPRYEQALYAPGSEKDFRLPDFTISFEGDTFYWEHLGMLSIPDYRASWERKKKWYSKHGFDRQLITSEDKPDGGIDAQEIERIAREYILLE